jgi:hypothetical protein
VYDDINHGLELHKKNSTHNVRVVGPMAARWNSAGDLRPARIRSHGDKEVWFAKSPRQSHSIQIPYRTSEEEIITKKKQINAHKL